jgi:three-Cys-motif partner protein
MSRKPYEWEPGGEHPLIQQHSVAKHEILHAYLSAYIQTLVSNPNREEFRLVLVDGFAGGGMYRHADTRVEVLGSPFVMMNAAKEAEAVINLNRRKAVRLDIDYFFIEKDPPAALCLRDALVKQGYGSRIGKDVFLFNSAFEHRADELIAHVQRRMPRSPRAIFLLDQYGYSEVPTARIASIIRSLPGSEVILTFAVDALLNYFSEHSELTKALLQKIGIPEVLRGRSFEDIKRSDRDWRLFVQACLYQELVEKCGAKFYTLFFIRSEEGHGDYWLIHFSQRARARDVMTRVHWEKNNHFVHYGGAGLEMFQVLGYTAAKDDSHTGQSSLFCFDDVARQTSTQALVNQIAPLIYADPEGVVFAELFTTTCNLSPASADLYKDAIAFLRDHREVEVVSANTGKTTQGKIQDGDLVKVPDQGNLFAGRRIG